MIDRIEAGVDSGAAAVFAGAVGYCAWRLLALAWSPLTLAALAMAAAAAAFLLCRKLLARFGAMPRRFAVPAFGTNDSVGELLLTEADRLNSSAAPLSDDVLILDDVLPGVGPDSRVVRLFDPAAMPTPGQLSERIDRHLDRQPQAPDASQVLFDALSELRLGLR
jgi:hypothetical protein